MKRNALNLRDLGGIPLQDGKGKTPLGLYLRSGKLSALTSEEGKCTLFHCTAGKDRTGIVSMALLKSYGVSDEDIICDYMRTNRNAFLPTIKKCLGVLLLTHNWELVKTCYTSFMAQRELIETAIRKY